MASKKINWILILQGWAMLWVVIGHSPLFMPIAESDPCYVQFFYDFAYSFHMALFMLISGYLYYLTRLKKEMSDAETATAKRGGGYRLLINNKIQRLLFPGLVFSIVALVLKVAMPGEVSRQIHLSVHELLHMYLYTYDNPLRELWFIVSLFWMFVLAPIWKLTFKKDLMVVAALLILIVLHLYHPDIELLCIGRVFSYAVFFYAGMALCKYEVVERILTKNKVLSLIVGLVVYATGFYTNSLVTAFGGIIISFALALIAGNYCPKLFWSFRDYTYQIFLMGIFAQIFVKVVYKHISLPYTVGYIACVLAGLYVPVIISKIVEKINWKPILLCIGLKKK